MIKLINRVVCFFLGHRWQQTCVSFPSSLPYRIQRDEEGMYFQYYTDREPDYSYECLECGKKHNSKGRHPILKEFIVADHKDRITIEGYDPAPVKPECEPVKIVK